MRIAIAGSRGMPLPGRNFGGFETFIGELAPRLAARGHEVTVYCRTALYAEHPPIWGGVRLRWLPAAEGKVFGTLTHTLLAVVDSVVKRFDAMLLVNPGNGLHCVIPRLLSRTRLAMNVDGVEWQRGKWGRLARWYFRLAARGATRFCHVTIADSRAIAELYRREFGTNAVFIPYAFDPREPGDPSRVEVLGLESKGYYLAVGRLLPENNTDYIVEEFAAGASERPLVVVGGTNYNSPFHAHLASLAGDRVRFLGHIDDTELLWDLYGHAYAYVHGHSVGGTNPALLQAMACKVCPIVLDVVFNREVVGTDGFTFTRTPSQLRSIVAWLDEHPGEAARRGELGRQRLVAHYSWTRVLAAYELALTGRPASESGG